MVVDGVYNRFNRWSRRGFWLKLLDALVNTGAVAKSVAIDSTYVKAQRAAFGTKGACGTGDRPHGGWTTKVHALIDVVGRPYSLMLTPLNVSDMTAAPALLEPAGCKAACNTDVSASRSAILRAAIDGATRVRVGYRQN